MNSSFKVRESNTTPAVLNRKSRIVEVPSMARKQIFAREYKTKKWDAYGES